MRDMVEQFCDAIDRAYHGQPEKLKHCVEIFSRVYEETMGVTVVASQRPLEEALRDSGAARCSEPPQNFREI